MTRAKVVINSAGIKALLKSDQIADAMKSRAEDVLAAAVAAAPVDTGAYRESLHVEVEQHPSRVVAQVVADAAHGLIVEANTGNLSRALDAAGGDRKAKR